VRPVVSRGAFVAVRRGEAPHRPAFVTCSLRGAIAEFDTDSPVAGL
jgi:hypothetical protein